MQSICVPDGPPFEFNTRITPVAFAMQKPFFCRGIAQLVEQWSPKPRAEGSSPSAPARKETDAERCPFFAETNLEPRHAERVEGCGSPVETSAYEVCRSTDRAGRRDQVLLPLPKGKSRRSAALFFDKDLNPRGSERQENSPVDCF